MRKVDCEKLKIYHAGEDITPPLVYAVMPPRYPPKTEKCLNCGTVRRHVISQVERKEWVYENPELLSISEKV